MLIDVSRKPVRLITEECPSFIVIRTMAMNELVNGLLFWGTEVRAANPGAYIRPKIVVQNGGIKHIETVLWLLAYQINSDLGGLYQRLHTVSRFQDQMTKRLGTWCVDFIIDFDANKNNFLLTLFDEVQNTMLFTVRTPTRTITANKKAPSIITPLERFAASDIRKQKFGENMTGFWGAVLEDEFDNFEL